MSFKSLAPRVIDWAAQEFHCRGMEVRWASIAGRNVGVNARCQICV